MKKIIYIILFWFLAFNCHAQNNVTQVECFVDIDLGVGLNPTINVNFPDSDITQSLNIVMPLSPGYHKLYLRTRDSAGNWSQTAKRNIQVVPLQPQNKIVAGEYFFDNDPQFTTAIPFNISPQDTDITQAFMAQVQPNASIGYHKLYGRVLDSLGNWSQTFRRNVQVVANDDSLYVIEVEYFFGSDLEFGNCSSVAFPSPQTDGSFTFNVPYPQGNYSFNDTLFLRVRDSLNSNWSYTTRLDSIDSLWGVGFNQLNAALYCNIFPNPVTNQLNIQLSKSLAYSYSVIDLVGQVYLLGNGQQQFQKINVSKLPLGIYILSVKAKEGTFTKKFIKQ